MSDLHAEAEQAARRAARRRYVIQGAISAVVACLSVASTLAIQGMTDAEDDRDSNAAIARAYSDQLEQRGIEPAVDPALIKGDPGDKGDRGPAGPTGATGPSVSDADVARAVRTYCQGGRCKGAPGQRGPAVTQSQVAAAVRAYCSANGRCRGPEGTTGPAGPAGEDGSDGATGPQGPPPTDQQINQAVAAFCANGGCVGPEGDQGPPGEPGPACPDGSTPETRNVVTTEAPLGEPAVLCIP